MSEPFLTSFTSRNTILPNYNIGRISNILESQPDPQPPTTPHPFAVANPLSVDLSPTVSKYIGETEKNLETQVPPPYINSSSFMPTPIDPRLAGTQSQTTKPEMPWDPTDIPNGPRPPSGEHPNLVDPNSRTGGFNPIDTQFTGSIGGSGSPPQPSEPTGGKDPPPDQGSGMWSSRIDPNTKLLFYFNSSTNESSWTRPPGVAPPPLVLGNGGIGPVLPGTNGPVLPGTFGQNDPLDPEGPGPVPPSQQFGYQGHNSAHTALNVVGSPLPPVPSPISGSGYQGSNFGIPVDPLGPVGPVAGSGFNFLGGAPRVVGPPPLPVPSPIGGAGYQGSNYGIPADPLDPIGPVAGSGFNFLGGTPRVVGSPLPPVPSPIRGSGYQGGDVSYGIGPIGPYPPIGPGGFEHLVAGNVALGTPVGPIRGPIGPVGGSGYQGGNAIGIGSPNIPFPPIGGPIGTGYQSISGVPVVARNYLGQLQNKYPEQPSSAIRFNQQMISPQMLNSQLATMSPNSLQGTFGNVPFNFARPQPPNPLPKTPQQEENEAAERSLDIRQIASKGSLSSFMDKRSSGIYAINSNTGNMVTSTATLQLAPMVSELIVIGPIFTFPLSWNFPQGCWLLKWTPTGMSENGLVSVHLDGTMRLQHSTLNSIKMSGDLYTHLKINLPWFSNHPEPNPGAGVPRFHRGNYNSYLRITSVVMVNSNQIQLGFQRHSLNSSNNWVVDGGYTVTMNRQTLPATSAYPYKNRYFVGNVYQNGACVASLSMGWVHERYRRVTLELDAVAASPIPTANAAGFTWHNFFKNIGFQASVVCSDTNVSESSGQSWNSSELHAAMLANRDYDDLDHQWRYHLFFVRRLDMTDRGVMYDVGGTEQREGAATASHWTIPNTTQWGTCAGKLFHETDAYIRTAMHELGHAFNLQHNSSQRCFMRVTPSIVAAGTASNPFPDNITWSYSDADLDRLRHWPDPVIRPGGLKWASHTYSAIPISDEDDPVLVPAPHLQLQVEPVNNGAIPLGAPVKLKLTCTNRSVESVPGPRSLNLLNPSIRGTVSKSSAPSLDAPTFSSPVKCSDGEYDAPEIYTPGQSRSDEIIVMQGTDGALFSSSGMHTITVEVSWLLDGEDSFSSSIRFVLSASCTVMISPPQNEAQARQALSVLSSRQLLPSLQMGLSLNKLDNATRVAVQTALSSPILKPHFAEIQQSLLLPAVNINAMKDESIESPAASGTGISPQYSGQRN